MKRIQRIHSLLPVLLLMLPLGPLAGQPPGYQTPPADVTAVITAPAAPRVEFSPARDRILLIEYAAGLLTVAQLAEPELRLAGVQFNPHNYGPSRVRLATGLVIKKTAADTTALRIRNLPRPLSAGFAAWSPDGQKVAFCRFLPATAELWVIDVPKAEARRVTDLAPNATLPGAPFAWLPDSRGLLCRAVPPRREGPPAPRPEARGPVVLESNGDKSASRTYSDLLTNPQEEDLFAYYATAQLYRVGLEGGRPRRIGPAGLVYGFSPSPDGKYTLIKSLRRPFSYLVGVSRFPLAVQVYDHAARLVRTVAELPLLENVPMGRDAALPVARGHAWRPDRPATLYWAEARDGGDPRKTADVRDEVFSLDAPFAGPPGVVGRTGLRFEEIHWGNDTLAILVEKWWGDRKVVWRRINPRRGGPGDTLFTYSSENRYTHPGEPESKRISGGGHVLVLRPDGTVPLFGYGASEGGDQPFVDLLDLRTNTRRRVWQSQPPYYEVAVATAGSDGDALITRRESAEDTPNYFVRRPAANGCEQVTFIADPYPGLRAIQHRKLHYTRADGIKLSADLYLPAGHTPDKGPLPALLWAYPVEYQAREAASQTVGSPHRYVGFYSMAMLLAMQGYAVIDNATFPVVARDGGQPNDSYLEQLEASARAAIGEGVRLGVVDSARVAVGGHSYGAFMAANLVTHTRLFRAGIAQSGAYNRTLTPFGFQREERTYWQAPDLYNRMSPFMNADRMKAPLLLIHGEADNNTGTFPMQSERYFGALKGLGAKVRYVCLPYEGHSYQARESLLHVVWEMHAWLDKHLKPATPELPSGK